MLPDRILFSIAASLAQGRCDEIRHTGERLATAAAAKRRVVVRDARPTPVSTPRAPAANAGNPHEEEMPMSRKFTLGEFAQNVANAITKRGPVDERFTVAAAAPTPSQEQNGADGGYAAPPDVRADVARLVLGEESLLGRTNRTTTARNSVTIPADAAPAWATASGPQPKSFGEAQLLAQSKIAAASREVKLQKLDVLIPASDELVEDAPALDAYLRAVVPARMSFKVDDWLINGDGDGVRMPLGFLKAGAKITQAAEGGQTAATINLANTSKMFTRIHAACLPTAVWLAHPETAPQLQALGFPHYAPAGVSGGPQPTLHGLPVLYREACAPLGTEGDLLLVDPLSYFAATRDPPTREDVSIHLWFDYDLSAFRFSMRLGGMPWWAAPITRYKTATTISTIVSLATRP
jgi:HK97 family phage major capsid protein